MPHKQWSLKLKYIFIFLQEKKKFVSCNGDLRARAYRNSILKIYIIGYQA